MELPKYKFNYKTPLFRLKAIVLRDINELNILIKDAMRKGELNISYALKNRFDIEVGMPQEQAYYIYLSEILKYYKSYDEFTDIHLYNITKDTLAISITWAMNIPQHEIDTLKRYITANIKKQ